MTERYPKQKHDVDARYGSLDDRQIPEAVGVYERPDEDGPSPALVVVITLMVLVVAAAVLMLLLL